MPAEVFPMVRSQWLLYWSTFVIFIVAPMAFGAEPGQHRETSRGALEVLKARSGWKELPSNFLATLAKKLKSPANVRAFVDLCERTGIFEARILHFVKVHRSNPEFAIERIGWVLTSHAGSLINRHQYSQAKNALELGLLLSPDFWPAWGRLSLIAFAEGDCRTAVFWADKVISAERTFATEDEEKEAADALGDPNIIGAQKKAVEAMKAVKEACR